MNAIFFKRKSANYRHVLKKTGRDTLLPQSDKAAYKKREICFDIASTMQKVTRRESENS